ncbi:unnamed protein product [Effrenium voratum]|nr:unnamed protein product [Effrenium voratum]
MAAVFEEQGPAYISLDGAAAMPLPAWSNYLERTWDPEWQALLPGTPGQDYDFPKLKLWAELGANLPVLPMDGAQAPMVFSEAEPLQLVEPKGNTNKELLKRQLQKTQLCMFWKRNCCAKGTDCTFAHSLEESEAAARFAADLPLQAVAEESLPVHCHHLQVRSW